MSLGAYPCPEQEQVYLCLQEDVLLLSSAPTRRLCVLEAAPGTLVMSYMEPPKGEPNLTLLRDVSGLKSSEVIYSR